VQVNVEKNYDVFVSYQLNTEKSHKKS